MGLLDGEVVVVTGAARGMGRAHAVTSAREGADVVALDIARQIKSAPYDMSTDDDLNQTCRQVESLGRRALGIVADVRSQEEMDRAVARTIAELGHIDALIANAAIWTMRPFWMMSDDEWQDVIDTNLTGVWRIAKAVAPHMIERQAGSIVLISSVNGVEPGDQTSSYVAAKHGVLGLMKNLALELAPHGVRCNAICPSVVDTPMIDNPAIRDRTAGHERATRDELVDGVFHSHALRGRSLLPAQAVADAALYLNSGLASEVTGVTLPVDAGHLILNGFNHAPHKRQQAGDPTAATR
jgi:SDR family mycofactocin-dependent oxidoreductase